jgi:hypothetical protein
VQYLKTGRGISFKQMFAMKEYPQDVMPLYAQGHSTAQWLIESRGREAFLEFLADGMRDENWESAVHQHYGFTDLLAMQNAWNDWVKQGRPRLTPETSPIGVLASNTRAGGTAAASPFAAQPAVLRTQSPDDIRPIPAAGDRSSGGSVVTVASGSGSVYAVAAQRAERERQQAAQPKGPSGFARRNLYDASRTTGTAWR